MGVRGSPRLRRRWTLLSFRAPASFGAVHRRLLRICLRLVSHRTPSFRSPGLLRVRRTFHQGIKVWRALRDSILTARLRNPLHHWIAAVLPSDHSFNPCGTGAVRRDWGWAPPGSGPARRSSGTSRPVPLPTLDRRSSPHACGSHLLRRGAPPHRVPGPFRRPPRHRYLRPGRRLGEDP